MTTDVRTQIRLLADGIVNDSLISYVAMLQERGLATPENVAAAFEEWTAALHEHAVLARGAYEDYTSADGSLDALRMLRGMPIDVSSVESLIAERRAQFHASETEMTIDLGAPIEEMCQRCDQPFSVHTFYEDTQEMLCPDPRDPDRKREGD